MSLLLAARSIFFCFLLKGKQTQKNFRSEMKRHSAACKSPAKKRQRSRGEARVSVVSLQLDDKFIPNWPFRVLEEKGAPFLVKRPNQIEFNPVAHLADFPLDAPGWLVPWFSLRCEAVAGFKLAAKAKCALASASDWRPEVALRPSFEAQGPFSACDDDFRLHLSRSFSGLSQHGKQFLLNIEQAWIQNELGAALSRHLDSYLNISVTKALCQVKPNIIPSAEATVGPFVGELPLDNDPAARFTSPELDSFLGPSLGLSLNVVTGQLNADTPISLDIRGCLLTDTLNHIPMIANFLRTSAATCYKPTLIVVSKKTVAWWIEVFPEARIVHDEASWIRSRAAAPVTIATFEFLSCEKFHAFHSLVADRHACNVLATLFSLFVAKDSRLLESLTPEQRDEFATNLFRVELSSFFRLVGLGHALGSLRDAATRLLRLATKEDKESDSDCEHDRAGDSPSENHNEFYALLGSRLSLHKDWSRVILDNPKCYLYNEFKRENRARFSAEHCGLHCKRLAFGDTTQKSRVFLNFALVLAKGFKIVIEAKPFCTFQEMLWCMELLDLRLRGRPWTQVASEFALNGGEGLLSPVTKVFRQRLFSWASLMTVAEICALKRLVLEPRPVSILYKLVQPSPGELAVIANANVNHRTPDSDQQQQRGERGERERDRDRDRERERDRDRALTCLPYITRELAHPQKTALWTQTCSSCDKPTSWATSCLLMHSLCLSCLDSWQADRLTKRLPEGVTCPICRHPVQKICQRVLVQAEESSESTAASMDNENDLLEASPGPVPTSVVVARVRSESGSKVAQLIEHVFTLDLEATHQVLVVLSASELLLREAILQSRRLFSGLRMSRYEGGAFVLPCDRILFSSYGELRQNGSDFARCGCREVSAIFMEPAEMVPELLRILSPWASDVAFLDQVEIFHVEGEDTQAVRQLQLQSQLIETLDPTTAA
jgi:hypothetical protein